MSLLSIKTAIERWPIAGSFAISRGSKTEAVIVTVELSDGAHIGRGECVPYPRYGETPDSVVEAINKVAGQLRHGITGDELRSIMPFGASRNAIDCALWDLACKKSSSTAAHLAKIETLKPLLVTYTISLGSPETMAAAARKEAHRPLLKVKLGQEGDADRLAAIRDAVPKMRLIVDANEGWNPENLATNLAACAAHDIELVEQPLPAGNDDALATIARPHQVKICADESVFDRESLPALQGKYDAVNIKLDKTGGLTEALATAATARQMGFDLMVGCMVSTSLSMAPAFLVAQQAVFTDLDGALLLAKDRPHGMRYENGLIYPPEASLWG